MRVSLRGSLRGETNHGTSSVNFIPYFTINSRMLLIGIVLWIGACVRTCTSIFTNAYFELRNWKLVLMVFQCLHSTGYLKGKRYNASRSMYSSIYNSLRLCIFLFYRTRTYVYVRSFISNTRFRKKKEKKMKMIEISINYYRHLENRHAFIISYYPVTT